MNRKDKLIAIELIPGRAIPKEQVEEIQDFFSSEGIPIKVSASVYIRKSLEEMPPILVFTFGALAGGFLGAVGKDSWEAFKRGVNRAILLLKKKWGRNPQVQLQVDHEDSRIIINLPTEAEDLIEEAMNKLPAYLDKRPKGSAWITFNKDIHQWEAY